MLKKTSTLFVYFVPIFLAACFLNIGGKVRHHTGFAQNFCIEFLSAPSPSHELAQALFCGFSRPPHEETQSLSHTLTQMGLIHILVASGANVYFTLEAFQRVSPLKLKRILQSLSLILLLLASGFEAPIMRACIQVLLHPLSRKASLGLTGFRRVSLANILYLLLFPFDAFSLSFQLSAVASYGLAYVQRSPLRLHLALFILMSPLLVQLQSQRLFFILNNLVLVPLLTPLLMILASLAIPSSLLPFHEIHVVLDLIFQFLHSSLMLWTTLTDGSPQRLDFLMYQPHKWERWSYFISLVFCFEFCELIKTLQRQRFIQNFRLNAFTRYNRTLAFQRSPLLKRVGCGFLFIILLQPQRLGAEAFNYYIIWNTGYGQWQTLIYNKNCLHIDLGAERLRFDPKLMALCQAAHNQVIFTHLDRHHLNLSWFYKKWLNPHCPHFWKEFKAHKSLDPIPSSELCHWKYQPWVTLHHGRFAVGGHTPLPSNLKAQLITLPHHGALTQNSKHLRALKTHLGSTYMWVSSKKLRSSEVHSRTETWFKTHAQQKIIYTHKWGHLIFGLK